MSKTVLSFDIGESYIKVAKYHKGKIQIYAKQTPENLVKDGVVQMPNMMTDLLKSLKKEF